MSSGDMATHDQEQALKALRRGGGMLFPFLNGYEELTRLLNAVPPEAWRYDEAVLGGLVVHFVKNGQIARAKSYLRARDLQFERSYRYEFLELLLAIHLGETVSNRQLAAWRRLERRLPLSEPLLQGLYYNSMMVMHVRIGGLEDARIAGQQAISCYREARHVYLEHFIHIHLADMDVLEGRLRQAMRRLQVAERCLTQSGHTYGNELEVIETIRLAIAYERGAFETVLARSADLRTSLVNGDSWSELFFQLARIAVLSAYFTKGLQAALRELELFQADYVRRHAGRATAIEALSAMIWQLEWNPNEAEQSLGALHGVEMHSALGETLLRETQVTMQHLEPGPADTPRALIVADLQAARRSRGRVRLAALERAVQLAYQEGQIAPFLEHRDVFLGVTSQIKSAPNLRRRRHLLRMVNQIIRRVDESYVIPEPLRRIGFNRRQYRVTAALQSGATNKQVARQLGTSEATVKYHLTSLYRLAGVQGRTQFIAFMDEIGISAIS